MSYVLSSAARAEGLMKLSIDYDRPADIIADLIHYCNQKGITFEEELAAARGYVEEEINEDQDEYYSD